MNPIPLIVWLLFAIVICLAVLGVVRAVLALPSMSGLRGWGPVIYALIVLLVVLVAADMMLGRGWFPWGGPSLTR